MTDVYPSSPPDSSPTTWIIRFHNDLSFRCIGSLAPPEADPQNPPATSHQDIRTWELPGGAILRLGKGVLGGSDRAVTFSPDRNHIAVAGGIGL